MKVLVISLILVLVMSGALPLAASAQTQVNAGRTGPSNLSARCPEQNVGDAFSPTVVWSGILSNGTSGDFVSASDGTIWWCGPNTNIAPLVAYPPDRTPGNYYGLGGMKTANGLVLIMADYSHDKFWLCFSPSTIQCTFETGFIDQTQRSPVFCEGMTSGHCYPYGPSIDKKLNIYYADPVNEVVVKCTYKSQYQNCSVIVDESSFGGNPISTFVDSKGNLWSADHSCNGVVYKNAAFQGFLGDSLDSIAISSANPTKTPHVYVGVSDDCFSFSTSGVYDFTDGNFLASPFPGAKYAIPGLTSTLHFTNPGLNGYVYYVKDKS